MIYTNLNTDPTRDFTGRTWVFETINAWLTEADKPRYFLLSGEPGSGKTAIAARLCQFAAGEATAPDNLRGLSTGFLSANYFCFARDSHSVDPYSFVQSIALQLSKNQAYAQALVNVGEKEIKMDVKQSIERVEAGGVAQGIVINTLDVSGLRPQTAFNRAVRDPLEMIYQNGFDRPIIILVDALDEALTHEGDTTIVDLLARLEKLPVPVRFMLTSRQDDRVENEFLEADGLLLSAGDYDQQNRQDLQDYMQERLKRDPALAKQAAALKPDQVQALVAEIINKAAGNFLYVSFLLQAMAEGRRTLTKLEGLPEGLDALYYKSLDRVVKLGDKKWATDYAPLMGGLSVAYEGLTPTQLQGISGQADELLFWENVDHLRQFVEEAGSEENQNGSIPRYRLYHQSVTDFLRRPVLKLNGKQPRNRYYLPAEVGHQQMVTYYQKMIPAWKKRDWDQCDPYALSYLVRHIQLLLNQAQPPVQPEAFIESLYEVTLDPGFRQAQRRQLGDTRTALANLHTALAVALDQDDLVKALACIAAYRDTLKSESIIGPVFEAVRKGKLNQALERAEAYGQGSAWAKTLYLYLGWEAAQQGDATLAAKTAGRLTSNRLGEALLVHAARTLAATGKVSSDALSWLTSVAPNHDWAYVFEQYQTAVPPDAAERDELVAELNKQLNRLGLLFDEGSPEAASMVPFLDEEDVIYRTTQLQDLFFKLATEVEGQTGLNSALNLVLTNPYPQYRDIGLNALGVAALAVPDPAWTRIRLQRILRTALDEEGVTFTFDLAAVLLAEAEARSLQAPELTDLKTYVDQARDTDDRWGTSVRAKSAWAAAFLWQNRQAEAFAELKKAEELSLGYAGYATATLLALANRWLEFGRDPSSDEVVRLVDRAEEKANQVRAPEFREARLALVAAYRDWLTQPIPDFEAVQTTLTNIPDRATRRTYKEYVSARWTQTDDAANWENLKALLPLMLIDASRLDTVLARLLGLRLSKLDDDELAKAVRICSESLTTARPWEMGQWR